MRPISRNFSPHTTTEKLRSKIYQRVFLTLVGLIAGLAALGFGIDPSFGEFRENERTSSQRNPPLASGASKEVPLQVEQERGLAAVPEERGSLLLVLELMKESQTRLARKDTGPQTQQIQKRIIDIFESLMNQAMENMQQPAQGTSQDASQQAEGRAAEMPQAQSTQSPKSTNSGSDSTSGAAQGIGLNEVLQKIWGELPERERAAVLQHAAEAIVPKYRILIETYYRELSRGQESSR
ncbi:MAG: hypothetical protein ACUVQR_07055 [Thermogutta sp.]